MICTLEKGHEGQCIAGPKDEAGTCKKTAAKWFALDDPPTQGDAGDEEYLTEEEMATMTEGELVGAYRRTHVPSTRREATEWARAYIESRGG